MKHAAPTSKDSEEQGSLRQYVHGYILSLILTAAAFLITERQLFSVKVFLAVVIVLAVLQLFVQLFFFLDLDREAKPRWKSKAFVFMIIVVLTVVIGSLWIMDNLDYGHKHINIPDDSFIIEDEGFKP